MNLLFAVVIPSWCFVVLENQGYAKCATSGIFEEDSSHMEYGKCTISNWSSRNCEMPGRSPQWDSISTRELIKPLVGADARLLIISH